ncbi:MAG: leucine-rich repeat domain-containing protein [Synergistaceae bacterium]|nr:leucine-rich repeat domain-containing protein [Synergistaceae bacterium]
MSSSAAWADVEVNSTNFPAANFRNYVTSYFDKNRDGILSDSEIQSAKTISLNSYNLPSLKGIEHFIYLENLTCNNTSLRDIDLSANTALINLTLQKNNLTALDLSNNTNLTQVNCNDNALESIILGSNSSLTHLYCSNNYITEIDISGCDNLEVLDCSNNDIETLDVSGNYQLATLSCQENNLTLINFGTDTMNLTTVSCYGNDLEYSNLKQALENGVTRLEFDLLVTKAVEADHTTKCWAFSIDDLNEDLNVSITSPQKSGYYYRICTNTDGYTIPSRTRINMSTSSRQYLIRIFKIVIRRRNAPGNNDGISPGILR